MFCIEYFRSQLLKAQYLFSSSTLSASTGSAALENIIVKSLSTSDLQQTSSDPSDPQTREDLNQIKKYSFLSPTVFNKYFIYFRDISNLEQHANLLNQRYSNQISGWQTLGYFVYLFPW